MTRILEALRPQLTVEVIEGARRYILGEPGNRIRRIRDRAAFAASMSELVQSDSEVRRRALVFLARRRGNKQLAVARRGVKKRARRGRSAA